MRVTAESVAAFIKDLTARLTTEGDPAFPSAIVPTDQGAIDDGGGYGDPFAVKRPDFLQAAYDDLPGMVPMGDERR